MGRASNQRRWQGQEFGGRRGSWSKPLKRSKDKGPAGAEQTEQRVKGGHVQTVNRACETGLYSPCRYFHH